MLDLKAYTALMTTVTIAAMAGAFGLHAIVGYLQMRHERGEQARSRNQEMDGPKGG